MQPVMNQQAGNNVAVMKGYLKSPVILIRGLAEALHAVAFVGLVLAFFPLIKEIIGITSSDKARDLETAEKVTTAGTISVFFSVVPFLFIAFAYIFMYIKSRDASPASNPSAGASILNGFAIAQLIGTILLCVFGLIGLIAGVASSKDSGATVSVLSAGILSIAFYLALSILYKMFTGSISKNLRTSQLETSGVKAHGVFSVILAVFSGLYTVVSLYFLVALKDLPEIIHETSGTSSTNVAYFLADHGYPMAIFLLLMFASELAIYVFDAIIAFGYCSYIDTAKQNPAPYYGGYTGGYQQPYYGGYQNAPRQPAADPYTGYPNNAPQDPYANPYAGYPQPPAYGDNYQQTQTPGDDRTVSTDGRY